MVRISCSIRPAPTVQGHLELLGTVYAIAVHLRVFRLFLSANPLCVA